MGFLSALAPSKWHILALVFCLAISACGLEEPYGGMNNNEGVIEFVARPVGFNNINVSTKADASIKDPIEDVIYNLHFLLFENSTDGGRLIKYVSLNPTSPTVGIKIDKGLTNAYACFFANIDNEFISKIKTVRELKSAIYNITNYTVSENRLGVPVIQNGEQEVACIPMFESTSVDMSGAAGAIKTITLKRLFAKVVINLKLNIPNDNSTTYTLKKCTLTNLPTNVAITSSSESAWVDKPNEITTGESTTRYFVTPESIDPNLSLISGSETPYQFICYIPEYKVKPERTASQIEGYDSSKNPQIYKPLLCPNKRPAYITLEGYMGDNIYNHKIYLGEDNHSNFNLLRNTQYTNNITITGTSEANIDHRVTYTTLPTMLVNDEAANCYIITAPGKYQLDTYKGVCKDLSKDKLLQGYPFIIATDGKVALDLWNRGVYDDKIIMDVGNNGTLGQYLDILTSGGNAVVGLNSKEDATGEWIWTWHLWFSVEIKVGSTTLLSSDTQDYPSGSKLMDRNLGSSPSTDQILMPGIANGLYYKHGHRAPYFSSVIYPNATKYPGYKTSDVKTWTSVKETTYKVTNSSGEILTKTNYKSEMDPCPVGYRVPSSTVWYNEKNSDMNFGDNYFTYLPVSIFGGVNFDPIYYPYTSYMLNEDGDKYIVTDELKTNLDGSTKYYYTDPEDILFGRYNVRLRYTAKHTIKSGVVWSSSSSIYYELVKNQIFGDKIVEYKRKNESWDKAESSSMETVSKLPIVGYAINEILNTMIEQIAIDDEDNYLTNTPSNDYYAAQVRCVIDN